MDILTRSVSGSSLVQGYLSRDPAALSFYPAGFPGDQEAYRTRARAVADRFSQGDRERLAAALGGGGPRREERLRSFVEGDGLAVTTGQQPGLFGGPLFTIYKALTALALSRRLEGILERPVLPVFWVAAEDHDWEEVRGVDLLDPENELRRVRIPIPEGKEEAPLHRVSLGAELDAARERFLSFLPETDFSNDWRIVLEGSYREGATLPGAFARLLDGVLGDQGLFILSPEDPAIQEAALPLLLAEAEGAREVEEAVKLRGEELEDAGYGLQVPLLPGGVNLFFEGSRGRDRLFLEEDGFRLRRAGERISLEDLRRLAAEDPSRLSPNVLLRPVVESSLVPTVAYVAGPGETAYFAQTAPVFRAHGLEPPVIHPRFSAILLEGKIGKVLEKFDLPVEALARPHHELASELAREETPDSVRSALGELRGAVARSARALSEAVKEVDPTLTGPVDHLRNQSFSLVDEVERKVMQALKRENEIALAQLAKAQDHLFPRGQPQERTLSPFYYLFRYGPRLLEELSREARSALLPDPVEEEVLPG